MPKFRCGKKRKSCAVAVNQRACVGPLCNLELRTRCKHDTSTTVRNDEAAGIGDLVSLLRMPPQLSFAQMQTTTCGSCQRWLGEKVVCTAQRTFGTLDMSALVLVFFFVSDAPYCTFSELQIPLGALGCQLVQERVHFNSRQLERGTVWIL